jgi:hypothetical protein
MEEGTNPTDRVCFRLNYAGLLIESEERKLSITPTHKHEQHCKRSDDSDDYGKKVCVDENERGREVVLW